jgi:uncharacterized membrane protein YoaK (UPF0700 family)
MMYTIVNPQATMNIASGPVEVVAYRFSIFPLILIAIIACIVVQVFLSKRENKFIGLIIPILYLLASILFLTFALVISFGELDPLSLWTILLLTIMPEAIYMTIYFVSRGRINARNKRNQEMQKMNAQDL